MTLLQIFLIISAIIILILAVDIARKQKFNALHFLVFFTMWGGLLVFTFFPKILDTVWWFFWLQRGADLLVYSSIIFLVYFVLLLLSKHVENKESITHLIREIAIQNSLKKEITGKEVFVIRVYNEESVLQWVIQEILNKGYKNILVVNDGSTDMSGKILDSFWKKITVLNHLKNRWWWAALKTVLEYLKRYCKTDYIITFDADWQHSLEDLTKFFTAFKKDKKLDIVLWSRFIEKTQTNVPFMRKMVLFWGRMFTYFMSNIALTDSHNWYRVFKTKIIEKLEISMDWMEYASEIIESIWKHSLNYNEVPVNIRYTQYSLKKWQKSGNALSIAFRFIWTKFFK